MFNKMMNAFQNYANHRTRIELLRMDDRRLSDMGISRTLLLKGVDAWPWREEDDKPLEPLTINQPGLVINKRKAGNEHVINEAA